MNYFLFISKIDINYLYIKTNKYYILISNNRLY